MSVSTGKDRGRLVAVTPPELNWRQAVKPDGEAKGIKYCIVMPDTPGAPKVQMAEYDPGWTEVRHRHPEDEVLLLYDGELDVEGHVYKAPSTIYVPRGVLYGPLTAGTAGAKFFRIGYEPGAFQAAQAAKAARAEA